jgi:riboflavin kinase/FMN adenylyltransferase
MTDRDPLGLDGFSRDDSAIVTVGTFDGIHVGHRDIIEYVVARASETGGSSTVVTFDPHPREVMSGELVPLLTTSAERLEILSSMGVDRVIVIPFTRTFAQTSSESFVRDVICGKIGCSEIVVGHDHSFGRDRKGGTELLEEAGKATGFGVTLIPPRAVAGSVVSSSSIRASLVLEGNVKDAARMLGRRFRLAGRVVHGDGRGRAIGFPTANLEANSGRKVIPKRGVYAVTVEGTDERVRDGMMNIGVRPTFSDTDAVHVEVHVLEYDGDLYGQTLHVEFVDRLREERRFDSVEALIEQLSEDRRRCRLAVSAVS